MTLESFSMDELRASTGRSAPIRHLRTDDDEVLSFRHYLSEEPRAALIFFHGGGAHSGAGYQHLAGGLSEDFAIDVYTPDIRGHGASSGPRGDTSSPTRVWDDASELIQYARSEHPGVALFLGGHSSGAGLVLNYASQAAREAVDGYVFLSPQLGAASETRRPSERPPFARVDSDAFAEYAHTGGRSGGNRHAVHFNYPRDALAADPGLVSSITVNMSLAITPSAPENQFAGLDRPLGLWIGTEDELFLPERVLSLGLSAKAVRDSSVMELIPGATHLSVLLAAHEQIGRWIIGVIDASQA